MLLPQFPFAQSAIAFRNADEVLARANTLIATKNYDSAIALLKSAIERYPTETPLYLRLADCQELQGLTILPPMQAADPAAAFRRQLNRSGNAALARDLFETYGKATMYVPDIDPVRARVADLVGSQYPVLLGDAGPLALPGDPLPYLITLTDPQLPTEARGTCQGLITTNPLPVTPPYVRDPKYGTDHSFDADPTYGHWTFQRMLLAYDYDRQQRCWRLRFRVIWQAAPGQEDARLHLAQDCARLLLRLDCFLQAYTGLTPRFTTDGVNNVWLTEKGAAGGETYDDSIYLYNVGVPRSPTEWVRELAHEYGHEVLPPVGGYTMPEWDANGYLGERLFLRWLLVNRDPADSDAWVRDLDAREITSTRIDEVIRRFAALGPEAQDMAGTGKTAMDGFIGMACYLEISRGSQYLAKLLNVLGTPSYGGPRGFLETLAAQEAYYQDPEHAIVSLRLRELPAGIPLWVYLRDGVWMGEATGGAPGSVAVDGNEVKVTGATFTTPTLTKGWHRITLTPVGDAPMPDALKLVRQ